MLDAKRVLDRVIDSIDFKNEDITVYKDKSDLKERELWDKIKKSSAVINSFVANGMIFKLAVIKNVISQTGISVKAYVSQDKKYYVRSMKNESTLWDKPIILSLHTFYPEGVMEFVNWV